MSLKKRVYSVLIVSSSEKFNSSLSSLLPESKYSPVHIASNASAAKRMFGERTFDFVIINAPLHSDFSMRFAIDACNLNTTVVLLIVQPELHEEIHDKVAEHGVFTLPRPISKVTMLTALNWMSSARERLRKSEKKTLSIEERMEEIHIINRAKWVLISEMKMNEPDAHRYIEKQAMDRSVSKREIAEEIIKFSAKNNGNQ